MKDNQQVVASIELDDALGFDTGAAFDQPPGWSVDDQDLVSLVPAADGKSCVIAATGKKLGHGNISVAALVGGKSMAGSVGIDVTAGDAVAIKVSLGAPMDMGSQESVSPVSP